MQFSNVKIYVKKSKYKWTNRTKIMDVDINFRLINIDFTINCSPMIFL